MKMFSFTGLVYIDVAGAVGKCVEGKSYYAYIKA